MSLDGLSGRHRWSLLLPKDVPASSTARSAVRQWLRGVDQATVDAARNIVTELVSNAVHFGRPPIRLTVEQRSADVRIEVSDDGAGRPTRRRPGEQGGWGLEIVHQLADRHGLLPGDAGVWCELRTGDSRPD